MKRQRRPSAQTIAVLQALSARAPEPSHGYDLCRSLDLRAGTLYPILRRLDERGLVQTEWEQLPAKGRPPRHLYRLSVAGEAYAVDLGILMREEVSPTPPPLVPGARP